MGDKKAAPSEALNQGPFDDAPLPDKIGKSLRQIYQDVLEEDIPDDFLSILDSADDNGPETGSSTPAGGST